MFGLLPFRAVPLLFALILGVSAGALLHLEVNNAQSYYFPPDAPAVQFDREVRAIFPQDQVILALFGGDDLYGDRVLDGLEQITDTMSARDDVERVLSVVSIDHITGSADAFTVEKLLGRDVREGLSPEQRLARVRASRFAQPLLANPEGDVLALIVRPQGADNSFARLSLENALRAAIREAGVEPDLVGLTGNTSLDVAQLRSMIRDTLVFVPATTLLGLALMWFMFRRPLALVLTLLTTGTVSMASVAILVLSGNPYTLVSAMTPPLMTALSIATLLHLFSGMRQAESIGRHGLDRVLWSLDEVREPVLYSLLTTGAGLASLGLSPIPPIAEFGLAVAGGCAVLAFVAIKLLPPLIARFDRGSWNRGSGGNRYIDRIVFGLARIGIRRAGWVVLATFGLLAAGAPAILAIIVETDLYRFFNERHPLLATTKQVEQKLSGITFIQLHFDGGERDSLKDLGRLHRIDAVQAWLDQHPAVDDTDSMVDVIEEINWGFNGEAPDARRLPADAELLRQYLFIYDGRDLYDFVDRGFSRSLLSVSLNVRGANATGEVIEEIRAQLERMDLEGLDYEIVGIGRLLADQQELLVTGQIYSLAGSLVIIFGFLIWVWRSLFQGIMTMIPNVAPIAAIFILMGLLGIWLDMGTAIIASVAVGIAVDDTMHIYHAYHDQRKRYVPMVTALARSMRRAGRAVVATSIILAAQFLLLVSSPFRPTGNFGLLTAVGLLTALLLDLLFLPAFIVVWERTVEWLRRLTGRGRAPRAVRA